MGLRAPICFVRRSRPSLLQMEGQSLLEQETGSEAVRSSWLTLEAPGSGEGKKRGK